MDVPDYRLYLLGFLSYLLGAVPSGYFIAKWLKGIDIREVGSGNPGAANVYRSIGAGAGLATMAFDSFKGWLPVTLFLHCYPGRLDGAIAMGLLAIVGHVWTVFLGFRGGKGVATSAGVFMALMPLPMTVCVAGFILAIAVTGHISAGSMLGALLLPITAFAFSQPAVLTGAAAAVTALILYKHIPNLKMLVSGDKTLFEKGSLGKRADEKTPARRGS